MPPCAPCCCYLQTCLLCTDLKGWSSATAKMSSPMAAMVSCSWVCLAMLSRKYVMARLRDRSSPLDTMIFRSVKAFTTCCSQAARDLGNQLATFIACFSCEFPRTSLRYNSGRSVSLQQDCFKPRYTFPPSWVLAYESFCTWLVP